MINIDNILINSYERCASDVHLMVGFKPIFRIDGELIPIEEFPVINQEESGELLNKILTKEELARFNAEKELDFSYKIKDICRFRVNLYLEKKNLCFVARIIENKIPTLKELFAPDVFYDLVKRPSGLILVTGAAGVGKSTLIAAMLNEINNEQNKNIITIEDPIEFIHESKNSFITQRQIGEDTLSFANALKHVLREDPNVIVIGEMRDKETIASAITLAETGHLVFSTLHTISSSQTINRIVDVFPSDQQQQIRTQLSMSLVSIISQKLVTKKYGGRIAVREVLVNTKPIANLIRENKIPQMENIIQISAKDGMFTTEQDEIRLTEAGII